MPDCFDIVRQPPVLVSRSSPFHPPPDLQAWTEKGLQTVYAHAQPYVVLFHSNKWGRSLKPSFTLMTRHINQCEAEILNTVVSMHFDIWKSWLCSQHCKNDGNVFTWTTHDCATLLNFSSDGKNMLLLTVQTKQSEPSYHILMTNYSIYFHIMFQFTSLYSHWQKILQKYTFKLYLCLVIYCSTEFTHSIWSFIYHNTAIKSEKQTTATV